MSTEAKTAAVPVLMPKIGQAMEEGTVVEWHYKDGDQVTAGDILVTIETDKANYDLEAPASGPLRIRVAEGEEVPIQTVIAEIGGAGGAEAAASPPKRPAEQAAPAPEPRRERAPAAKILASPKAKRLAAEHGVDLSQVVASSADGVISTADVERYLAEGAAPPAAAPAAEASSARRLRERRKLTGMRKTAARRVAEAWRTIPHIVQMVDVDASGLVAERDRLRAQVNLTYNDIILAAAAGVMQENPDLNGTVEGDELLLFEGVDVGFAVDTPRGLVVPVIRDAAGLSPVEVAAHTSELIEAAREGHLPPEAIGGASVTVSNLGMYGIKAGTPVINLGEPVLVFVGGIDDRPAVEDGNLAVRPMLTLSIAYDHRVTDGVAAAQFTQGLKRALEELGGTERVGPPKAKPAIQSRERHDEDLGKRELRSTSEGMAYRVDLRTANWFWVIDEPREDGGTDEGPTPVEAMLGGLLACMTISYKFMARRRKLRIDRIDGWVQANESRYVTNIALELEIWSSEPEETLRALVKDAERACFVSQSLSKDIDYTVDVHVHSGGQS